METRTIELASLAAGGTVLEREARFLADGGVAVIPTETYYGLAASALSEKGVEAVYALKRRDIAKALPLIASDILMVEGLAEGGLTGPVRRLAAAFWPGPLTVVIRASGILPDFITGPGRTVAVRIPPLGALRALIRAAGGPLTATSANISGEKELETAAEAAAVFGGRLGLIIDGGRTPGGGPSTIVDTLSPEPRILREGKISAAEVLFVLAGERGA